MMPLPVRRRLVAWLCTVVPQEILALSRFDSQWCASRSLVVTAVIRKPLLCARHTWLQDTWSSEDWDAPQLTGEAVRAVKLGFTDDSRASGWQSTGWAQCIHAPPGAPATSQDPPCLCTALPFDHGGPGVSVPRHTYV